MTTPNTHVPSGHFSVDELLEDLKSFGQSVVDGIGEIADTVGGAISDFGDGLFGVEKEIYLSPLQTSAGAIEAINEGTSLIRAGANAAIFGERTQNKLPSIEAETVKEKNDEIINIFPDWFVDLADLKFEADNLNESSKRMCWDSMVDILTRKGGENLIKVVSGTVIIGGLSVANLPIGLATLGISFVVAGVNAWSAGKNEEDIADAMIDGYFDAAVFMGTSYVTGKGVAALVKKFGITTSLGTLSIESGVETLIEEITYTIQSGSVNILGALLNFFTNIGFNKIAEVPQKLLHSIGEALEKWGKKALKDLDDWFKSFDGGTGTLAKYGENFGKMGTYVENPNVKVDWTQYAGHAAERMQQRGMSQELVESIVENGKVLSQNNGSKYAYITQEGVVVVSNEGKLITAWDSADFDDNMKEIVKKLFGE